MVAKLSMVAPMVIVHDIRVSPLRKSCQGVERIGDARSRPISTSLMPRSNDSTNCDPISGFELADQTPLR